MNIWCIDYLSHLQHIPQDGHEGEALMSSLGEEEVFAGLGTSDTFSSLSDTASGE